MGEYYKLVNRTKMESIDPALHGRWGNKRGSIFGGGHPLPVMWLLVTQPGGRWHGNEVELIGDSGDDYYDLPWLDVTVDVLRLWRLLAYPGKGYWDDASWEKSAP